jgi:hypothetical protein
VWRGVKEGESDESSARWSIFMEAILFVLFVSLLLLVICLLGLRALLSRELAGAPAAKAIGRSAVERERARRLLELMQRRGRSMSFDELCGELAGHTREAVASGLVCLVEDGELVEELDMDFGRWVYSVPTVFEAGASEEALMTAHERAQRATTRARR